LIKNNNGHMMLTKWIQRVAGWDGLLPGFVWGTSAMVIAILPGNWSPLETLVLVLLAVVLPIGSFLLRLRFGCRAIHSNNCGWRFRSFQYLAFGIGISLLCLLDGMLVLYQVVPQGAGVLDNWKPLVVIYLLYLCMMIVAMFPGNPSKANGQ
jgi:hypothetical protein